MPTDDQSHHTAFAQLQKETQCAGGRRCSLPSFPYDPYTTLITTSDQPSTETRGRKLSYRRQDGSLDSGRQGDGPCPGYAHSTPPLIPRADDGKALLDISISRIRKKPVEKMSPISSAILVDRIRLFSYHNPAMTRMILWYGSDNPWGSFEG